MQGKTDTGRGPKPLNGWRSIADHLGRNQSTVKRWAKDAALPVHRPSGGSGRKGVPVYAFSHELDEWLREKQPRARPLARGLDPDRDETAPDVAPPGPAPDPLHTGPVVASAPSRRAVPRRALLIGGGLAFALLTGSGLRQALHLRAPAQPGPQRSDEARDLYRRGLFHMELRTASGLGRAIALFREARALEPGFTESSVALAQAYNLAVQYGVMKAEEGYLAALETARGVLATAPDHPGALAALAFTTFYWLRQFPAAYDLFEQALARDPRNADVHHWYALAVMHDRKFEIALREIQLAQEISPTSPSILANKGLILHHAGRDEEALAILEPLAEAQPGLLSPVSYLATIYLHIGSDRAFLGAYRKAAALAADAGRQEVASAGGEGLSRSGRTGMLEAMLDVQDRLLREGAKRAFRPAITAAYLDRTELALDYLELAAQRGEPDVLGIRLELPLHSLQGLPRYTDLVARIGFSGNG